MASKVPITGQDGGYSADLLIQKGYEVHGMLRPSSAFTTAPTDCIYSDPYQATQLFLHFGDLTDGAGLRPTIQRWRGQEGAR